ncbi:MAG: pyridoxamine 5'-phosphate oxidase family protein [Methanolobus sp.]|uniref:pyridoxamine 5'-phosphate oxidase family protein n=1 Tax=Methanolobus sp. TaxID=1874737 RepID=UPI00273141DE|nr:pyridoxamine 5'-phosphate oxidase family protein [Methanolobus sp.]MDP2218369.1 pyridoxamine 5'-phosphate oxidase family protein [Methanolobus sp.]
MTEEIKTKIVNYLSSHQWLNLGTADKKGKPMVHTMAFASDGATVYFVTDKNTHKVTDMMDNPNVAYTVDEDDAEVMQITGVQMQGKAFLVTDGEETNKAFRLMADKYPFIADMPSSPDNVFFKVEPEEAYYLDYSKGFNHRDFVTF